ncbi:nitroreductase family deazaflavin-dependent oxidoreductase [Actinoalloteichus caeruleus]|uniref:nitroreductase family deazaflavin-dependent oxidoreductase n=1 Tax=Actinoalloteichus cyanogriseus TaxID=2893586 RepID=UPI000A7591E9|nr:nitroreductase family deazaflavin-dependent oxidoreductase [Actinoalloteichus caeruleus]
MGALVATRRLAVVPGWWRRARVPAGGSLRRLRGGMGTVAGMVLQLRGNGRTTLRVRGWRGGRVVARPVLVTRYEGGRYLVSTISGSEWLADVRAARGRAVLGRGRRPVRLVEVDPADRAPVLRRRLEGRGSRWPGRPLPTGLSEPDFARAARHVPVFRVLPVGGRRSRSRRG